MSSTVEQIKDKLSIEEVVSQYVKLKPAGQNMKANCPFHNERTPSFIISPTRQTYHCFGCGVGGDIFSFIEAIEGIDFKGALRVLADKAGVEIKYDAKSKQKTDEKDRLFELMEYATEFFQNNIAKNSKVKKYLKSRGLTQETINSFRIGFADDSWDATHKHLSQSGYSDRQIERAGLIISRSTGSSQVPEKSGGYYDRFRSRIMFPIADSSGRIVAFSGRIFELSPKVNSEQPTAQIAKYINSPETPLYNKSKVLYGFGRAKQSIRRNDFAILVEGQIDLLASHQAGYSNTVAISGTALTGEHIILISRMSKNLVLALDADDAGLASATKSAKLALQNGFDVKVVQMPIGSDPAEIIKADGGVETWKGMVRNSKHIIEFLLDLYRARNSDERKFKLIVEREVVPYLNLIQSAIDKEHFIKKIAANLGTSEEAVKESLAKAEPAEATTVTSQNAPEPKPNSIENNNATLAEKLASIYIWKKDEKLKQKLTAILGKDELNNVLSTIDGRDELVFVLEETYNNDKELASDVENFLAHLRRNTLEEKLNIAIINMRKAEAENDEKMVAKLVEECNKLHKQLAENAL